MERNLNFDVYPSSESEGKDCSCNGISGNGVFSEVATLCTEGLRLSPSETETVYWVLVIGTEVDSQING